MHHSTHPKFLAIMNYHCGIAQDSACHCSSSLNLSIIWINVSFISYCKCSWKNSSIVIFHPHFHPKISFIHDTWQNILPHHQIFCPRCDIIYFKYFVNVGRISFKKFSHAPLLMLTYSCSCPQAHEIASLKLFRLFPSNLMWFSLLVSKKRKNN